MRKTSAKEMALGGMMAAAAVVVMCLGGLIPIATFTCPMLCILLAQFVLQMCGDRTAWAWYGVVAFLSILLAPDKEAAAIFLFLGYYPIIRKKLENSRLKLLWKLILFNAAILTMYALLIYVMGMDQIAAEYTEMGQIVTGILLIMGNVTFLLMDLVLGRMDSRRMHRRQGNGHG